MNRHLFFRALGLALTFACITSVSGATPAPGSAGTVQSDETIAELKKQIEQLTRMLKQLTDRVEQLEREKGAKPVEEPEIPPVELPKADTQTAPAAGTARATLTPDIAVFGINQGRFLSVHGDPDRNRLQLGEFEIAMEQPVYPGVLFKSTLTAGADEGFGVNVEEAYAQFSTVFKLPFGGLLGHKRLNFGKINPIHPHARPYADQPAVIANLVGTEALFGNGASLNYLFPFKNLFANLEVGLFRTDPAEEGADMGTPDTPNFYPTGLGVEGDFPMARLWLSSALGKASELEIGASHGFGRDARGDRLNLTGIDLTYRLFPRTDSRLQLQSEVFWHHRHDVSGGTGGHTRSGYYALLTYRPDRYYEYGIRLDNARLPWPLEGVDRSISLIWSNRLTESTLLRLQYKYGDRLHDLFGLPARRGFSEFYLQFIWGAGSHTHPLQ